jgi:mono/diheme cytochrome c family protein
MKRLYMFVCIALFIITGLLSSSCNSTSNQMVTAVNDTGSVNARIRRGSYLVNAVCNCMHCHSDRDFTKFSGPIIAGTEGKGGEEIAPGIFVRNITPYALGNWTDDEIYRVLTTGIRKNGDTLTVYMPYTAYAKMPKEEIYSIVAYLRTLKPIAYKVQERNFNAIPRQVWTGLYKTAFLNHAGEKIPLPSPGNTVKMGAYIVNAGNCNGCHTKLNPTNTDFDQSMYLAGGDSFNMSELHFAVTSANLTPDSATGLGSWTEAMFLTKIKNYRDTNAYKDNPGKYNSIMPWTIVSKMNDNDLKAIYAYLRTIKPVKNQVTKWP